MLAATSSNCSARAVGDIRVRFKALDTAEASIIDTLK
jgi:hypothetical protein